MSLYTLLPYASFSDDLIAGFMERYGHDPVLMAKAHIYVPTRRAKGALLESFGKVSASRTLLLPKMIAFGDLEGGDLKPTMPALKRQLLLAGLIRHESHAFSTLDFSKALAMAQSLLTLFDECAIEGVDPAKIAQLYLFDEAQHHMHIQQLLENVAREWPLLVAQKGYGSPAENHHGHMDAEMDLLRQDHGQDVVIVAGSTGSQRKTAEFMAFVATLPQGSIVLPGYDPALVAEDYEAFAFEPTHPFHGFSKLFQRAEFAHGQVKLWHESKVSETLKNRFSLVRSAMSPALPLENLPLENIYFFEADHLQDEAGAIAVLLKHVIENTPEKAVVVTPDRDLARRISAALRRFDIIIDDSSGVPLKETPHGLFLRLLIEMMIDDLKPLSLLAFLKNPFALKDFDVAAYEIYVRKNHHTQPLAMLLEDEAFQRQSFYGPLKAFYTSCTPLKTLLSKHTTTLELCFESLIKTMALLGHFEDEAPIFEGFCSDVLGASAQNESLIAGSDVGAIVLSLMGAYVVRETSGCHPRIALWGPLETRMQKADVMILAGLNEGVWPLENSGHFLLSPMMRQSIGLSSEERRIGLSAHDFMQSFCGGTVYLTRSLKKKGSPTLPSRFLVKVLYALNRAHHDLTPPLPFLDYAQKLNEPDMIGPVLAPKPNPDLHLRPRALPVTAIETFLRDPYSIFAKYILKLKPLPCVGENRDAQIIGDMMHTVLEGYYGAGRSPSLLKEDAQKMLQKYTFTYSQEMYLMRRLDFILTALQSYEQEEGVTPLCEIEGSAVFLKGDFTLYGRADRLDKSASFVHVVDYKTGMPPLQRDIKEGFAGQLSLLALIALKGGFHGVQASSAALSYWHLKGKSAAEAIEMSLLKDPENLIKEAEVGLERLMKAYLEEGAPYYATPRMDKAPRFHEYAHLERVEEWMSLDDE